MENFRPERFIPQEREPARIARASDPIFTPLANRDDPNYNPGYFQAPKRQPHLGYALAVLGLLLIFVLIFSVIVGIASATAGKLNHVDVGGLTKTLAESPMFSILLEALGFGGTLGAALLIFPRMWHRPFAQVMEWNAPAARAAFLRLILTGAVLSVIAQTLESFLTLPKEMPVDAFFKHPGDVWVIALFGTFVAPVCEELFFRGFLLRGFAIAYDWFGTRFTPQGRIFWKATDITSRQALIFSGILSSGLFAAMHAAQLGFAWNAVGVLWIVGGALTYIRIHFKSLAASALVHAAYNGSLFAVMFVVTGGFRHLDKLTNH